MLSTLWPYFHFFSNQHIIRHEPLFSYKHKALQPSSINRNQVKITKNKNKNKVYSNLNHLMRLGYRVQAAPGTETLMTMAAEV